MAKVDTLTFSRRVKDLIWLEINLISQILNWDTPNTVLFNFFLHLIQNFRDFVEGLVVRYKDSGFLRKD